MSATEEMYLTLTKQQRIYVDSRLQGMNLTQAARAAGYAHPNVIGHQLSKHPRVKAVLTSRSKEMSVNIRLKREDIIEGLQDAVRSAATSTELTAAWRELGRVIGAYEPEKIEVNINHNMTLLELGTSSDRQLLEAIDSGKIIEGESVEILESQLLQHKEALTPAVEVDYGTQQRDSQRPAKNSDGEEERRKVKSAPKKGRFKRSEIKKAIIKQSSEKQATDEVAGRTEESERRTDNNEESPRSAEGTSSTGAMSETSDQLRTEKPA